MPHIELEDGVPGIRSLVLFRPDTGRSLYALVQLLLRGESTLSEAERELIAAYVSTLNECQFCGSSHAAAARCLYADEKGVVDGLIEKRRLDGLTEKMRGLLHIAAKVRVSGREVKNTDILAARQCGATDREIHDTVLIAATFCMFNRYVDGLATFTPQGKEIYEEMGQRMAKGYHFPQTPNISK